MIHLLPRYNYLPSPHFPAEMIDHVSTSTNHSMLDLQKPIKKGEFMTALISVIAALMFFIFSCGDPKPVEQTTKPSSDLLIKVKHEQTTDAKREWRQPRLKH